MSWFLKQKDRLTYLNPDMCETMIYKRILRKGGGDLEHAITSRCIDPCSTEDYTNAMEDITIRTKPQERAPLKCHKCGSTSHLPNTCPKKTRINDIEIEKEDNIKEANNVSLHKGDSQPSEEEDLTDILSIENINVSCEVTEVHTHLPQYSNECMDLIQVQDAKMQKAKPARGKGYTAGSSCITKIVINNKEDKIHLDSEMKENPVAILFQSREAFASDNEPLAAINAHEVDIMLNVGRPYPPLLRRPAYPASPRAREALETHID
ncbi:hypothetical protein O181_103566 [Austropuccinia psidii MF-1]|uniref:CCHC-type domain-containing protein n=1 Tax=Austropuccinia psidii MF-1 TaxID=1389203 RepID=A0A9Q3JKQ9_9BASI|nr:hypothetical protein [Austropuccinia psidii MF-1]